MSSNTTGEGGEEASTKALKCEMLSKGIISPLRVTCQEAEQMRSARVKDCQVVNLPKIADPRGNLTFIESGKHVPFDVKRVFYLYDVPGGESRGGHANRACRQFIVAMSGSFDVIVDDGCERRTIGLNRSYYGLYVPNMIWRELDNFSSGSVCLVLASDFFDESDYIRNYKDFLAGVSGQP